MCYYFYLIYFCPLLISYTKNITEEFETNMFFSRLNFNNYLSNMSLVIGINDKNRKSLCHDTVSQPVYKQIKQNYFNKFKGKHKVLI